MATAYRLGILLLMLFGLPMLGTWLAGRALAPYLQFPPRTDLIIHAPFSWAVFAIAAAVAVLLFGLLAWLAWPDPARSIPPPRRHRLPWWGWLAGAWLIAAWSIAWSRAEWLEALQPLKFPLLWLGYIVLVNALAWARSGRSPLTHQTGLLLALFPVSVLFWWYFEYLNRFVQNWHYLGTAEMSAGRYFVHASLAFSTVLPAIASSMALIRTVPALNRARTRWRLSIARPRAAARIALGLAAAGLLGIGAYPDQLFPLLWLAPLLALWGVRVMGGGPTGLEPLARGHWEPVCQAALAALMCGFLWELWNLHSHPKWVYTLPYLQRFEVFEMPLLGYAGYITFGLECALVIDWLKRSFGKAAKTPPAG